MQHAEDINQKKRAIYFALLNYLDPNKAATAADIWFNEFSHKPAFELQTFISRITAEFNMMISRKDIQQAIIKMLLTKNNELEKENYPVKNSSSEIKTTILQPSHIVFSLLITRWLSEVFDINRNLSLSIKQYIYNNLIKLHLSFEEIMNIKRWLNTNDKTFYIKDLTPEQLKKMFHFCYVGSCEYIGPVKTDKIVSDIVKSLEQIPEAISFSPKNFF